MGVNTWHDPQAYRPANGLGQPALVLRSQTCYLTVLDASEFRHVVRHN